MLKGGETLGVKKKSKKKKKKGKVTDPDAAVQQMPDAGEGQEGEEAPDQSNDAKQPGSAHPDRIDPKFEYEKEFKIETDRVNEGKARSSAWGATYRAPPNILHGYSKPVSGDTYEERLDLRCAKKADRMCK